MSVLEEIVERYRVIALEEFLGEPVVDQDHIAQCGARCGRSLDLRGIHPERDRLYTYLVFGMSLLKVLGHTFPKLFLVHVEMNKP